VAVHTIATALTEGLGIALQDESVVLIGEDVGRAGGVFRVSDGLLERFGSHRVIDTPVAESGIVGAAFGMAVAGLKPIAEIQFMGFSYPAYDQIVSHVARIRNRSRHRFTAPMVIRMPFGGGFGAAEHHSESTEAVYAHIPGLKVVVPATPADAKGLLLAAVDDPDPVILLEPIRLYRSVKEEVAGGRYTTPIGKARVERDGSDVVLVSWGAMTKETRSAAEQLAAAGVDSTVIDLRTIVPWDSQTVVEAARSVGRVVIASEAPRTGGFAAEVSATITERALYSLEAPVERVAGLDTVFPLKRSESHFLPSVDQIVAAAMRTLEA